VRIGRRNTVPLVRATAPAVAVPLVRRVRPRVAVVAEAEVALARRIPVERAVLAMPPALVKRGRPPRAVVLVTVLEATPLLVRFHGAKRRRPVVALRDNGRSMD